MPNERASARVPTCATCAFKDHHSKRVVSDKYAIAHSRPWMVMLKRDGEYLCGAALVNGPPNHQVDMTEGSFDILLTAAHCLFDYNIDATVKPIALSNFPLEEVTNCSIAGWGRHEGIPDSEDPNTVLSVLDLPDLTENGEKYVTEAITWNKIVCLASHHYSRHLSPPTTQPFFLLPSAWELIILYFSPVIILYGDSGSPMTCRKDGRIFLQGITSTGSPARVVENFGPHEINFTVVNKIIHYQVGE
uniref:Peptidase S1 domain-containing protein n=1 Tax=Romanomermis culicivorax TaxID=13658 RepID=A0A915J6V2_ROMCU